MPLPEATTARSDQWRGGVAHKGGLRSGRWSWSVHLLRPLVAGGIDFRRIEEGGAVISQVEERVPGRPIDAVPRLAWTNGLEAFRAELAQLDADLLDGQWVPVAVLVGMLDIAGVQQLTDHVRRPVGLA